MRLVQISKSDVGVYGDLLGQGGAVLHGEGFGDSAHGNG